MEKKLGMEKVMAKFIINVVCTKLQKTCIVGQPFSFLSLYGERERENEKEGTYLCLLRLDSCRPIAFLFELIPLSGLLMDGSLSLHAAKRPRCIAIQESYDPAYI